LAVRAALAALPPTAQSVIEGLFNERDRLHPTIHGYQIWADALKAIRRASLDSRPQ
jgi:lysophospholipase L1-like esterase